MERRGFKAAADKQQVENDFVYSCMVLPYQTVVVLLL